MAEYNKLVRETTTFPLSATSIKSDPTYSHIDLPAVSQTQMPAAFDGEYDVIASTMRLEHRDKQPASQANMATYYNVVTSDAKPSSHQSTPHPPNHNTPVPYVNVQSLTHRTSGEEDTSNNRNLALFDDPSYAALPLIPSDNGNKTGQF